MRFMYKQKCVEMRTERIKIHCVICHNLTIDIFAWQERIATLCKEFRLYRKGANESISQGSETAGVLESKLWIVDHTSCVLICN